MQMKLDALLTSLTVKNIPDVGITGIAEDSRNVKAGYAFIACRGETDNGERFVDSAITQGAVVIILDSESEIRESSVPLVYVKHLKQQVGVIASNFYRNPSHELCLIGITGTNGKTSCSHLVAQCLDAEQIHCGILGTMGYGFQSNLKPLANTTPGPVELQAGLAELLQQGARAVAMEVSSHGLEQFRTEGCKFSMAVFTNLSRDHLDYHGSMEAYGAAKLKLFANPDLKAVIVNVDDDFAIEVIAAVPTGIDIVSVGLHSAPTASCQRYISAEIIEKSLAGCKVKLKSSWGDAHFHTSLLGEFNVSNLLLVLAVSLENGVALDKAVGALETLHAPIGRLESFSQKGMPLVVVDYAHTPDALQKVLQTLHAHTQGAIWVVFGCGGDRDTGKRPLMGEVAEQYADRVVITDDNPRTESSACIIDNILSGIKDRSYVEVLADRKLAIRKAITTAAANDIVLIAGKGHEDYQIIGTEVLPFSDREIVTQILREVA